MATSIQTYQNDLADDQAKWFAILTKVKSEKSVAQSLNNSGIKAYVPLQKITRIYTRKRRIIMVPLIYRYVFVHILKAEYGSILETPNVEGFLRFKQQLIAIPNHEIEWLQRITGETNEISLDSHPFAAGESVEVVYGNLTGLKGKLIQTLGKNELLIELDHVGFGLRIQVDPNHLRKLG